MDELIANSKTSLETAHQALDALWEEHKYVRVNLKTGKQRSPTMNRCMHKWLEEMAVEMNNRGIDMYKAFPELAEIPATKELLKENWWKEIQEAVTGFDSTTSPSNAQYQEIFEILSRYAALNWGISIGWPNKDTMGTKS
jgi:hypothetical protein